MIWADDEGAPRASGEHYHVPLGHEFPGFALLDVARTLGISNATHNNTRGHITRRLEEALVREQLRVASGEEAVRLVRSCSGR